MMAVIDLAQALQLELAYQAADGKATVRVRGELDIATADQAYAYLRDVVDSQDGPVLMNLSELTFCDAAGLGVLARVAGHARRSGRSLKLTAARPVAAPDHAHHRHGRGVPRGPQPGRCPSHPAPPGHGRHDQLPLPSAPRSVRLRSIRAPGRRPW